MAENIRPHLLSCICEPFASMLRTLNGANSATKPRVTWTECHGFTVPRSRQVKYPKAYIYKIDLLKIEILHTPSCRTKQMSEIIIKIQPTKREKKMLFEFFLFYISSLHYGFWSLFLKKMLYVCLVSCWHTSYQWYKLYFQQNAKRTFWTIQLPCKVTLQIEN